MYIYMYEKLLQVWKPPLSYIHLHITVLISNLARIFVLMLLGKEIKGKDFFGCFFVESIVTVVTIVTIVLVKKKKGIERHHIRLISDICSKRSCT